MNHQSLPLQEKSLPSMSKLANLDQTFVNAARFLGRPGSHRWRIFDAINGKLTAPEIAEKTGITPNHCADTATDLYNKGLIEPTRKVGKAVVYRKIPELRNVNLLPYTNRKRFPTRQESQPARPVVASNTIAQSKNIEAVLNLGSKYGIANINQDWTDALVILNFVETLLTKFLMDHGYTEPQIEKLHWDEKATKVQDKFFEEAKKKNTRPRKIVLSNLASYRTNRNTLDHEAHIPDASIRSHEVGLLLKLVQALAREIFDEHREYCSLP
jgi:hypothetical protein